MTVGTQYGAWTVLEVVGPQRWRVRCSCGTEAVAYSSNLTRGKSTKCRQCRARGQVTHGLARTATYRAWQNMHKRCKDPAEAYHCQRGITVCERWNVFANFLADMGERPAGGTLDRMDGGGPYEPGNCRWASASKQIVNQRKKRGTSSRYRGVTFDRQTARWRARIKPEGAGRYIELGRHESEEQAALAYNRLARKYGHPLNAVGGAS